MHTPANTPGAEARAIDKPVIGLLGGIGAGKSLVARQLGEMGCAVIDADQLAKDALDEPSVRDTLQRWWGQDIVVADGRVDRKRVGRIVFNDSAQLRRLEEIVHPMVHRRRAELRREYLADERFVAVVEDTPLLMERGLDDECDVLVFVASPRSQRLERVRATRGWDEAELERRERSQLPLDKKLQRADYVVENNAGEAECWSHVRRVLSQILSRQPDAPR